MRILFVAMVSSIHTARWIKQISKQGWDIHIVPSVENMPLHPYLQGLVTMHPVQKPFMLKARRLMIKLLARWPIHRGSGHARRLSDRLRGKSLIDGLDSLIHTLKPDIVHSMELQHAAYQTLPTKLRMGSKFPTWIVSNWGSDIYLFGRLPEHKERIQQIVANCDYYACECKRDVAIAHQFGLQGQALPVVPCGGGFDLEELKMYRKPGPVSARRTILLKGAQGWAGRSLVGLRAIELCADLLKEYRIVMQLPSPDSILAANILAASTGLDIEIATHGDYMQAIRRFGAARIHLGLSISDGISQSLLEAMVMGAFPIQSYTACADEWIEDGKSGFLVPAEDSLIVAEALRRALTDDALVDQADAINAQTAQQRLAYAHVKEKVVSMYNEVFEASTRAPVA